MIDFIEQGASIQPRCQHPACGVATFALDTLLVVIVVGIDLIGAIVRTIVLSFDAFLAMHPKRELIALLKFHSLLALVIGVSWTTCVHGVSLLIVRRGVEATRRLPWRTTSIAWCLSNQQSMVHSR